ncbi:MAG: universal stress protein [Bacteroidota bacterium]
MKKILVPVDFSDCSRNAFFYAKSLAARMGYGLKVVHVYTGNLNPKVPRTLQMGQSNHESIQHHLQHFIGLEDHSTGTTLTLSQVEIEIEAIFAMNVVQQLILLTREDSNELIVMGTTGAADIVDRLLGGTSAQLAQRAYCPIILVPKGISFGGFKNILYASNDESIGTQHLEQIIQMGKQFQSNLHFVYVEEEGNEVQIQPTIFKQIFEQGNPSFTFTLNKIVGSTPIEGLNEYAEDHAIDLLVLVNRQRKNWENIFGQSLTKQMAVHLNRPILVYHLQAA